MFSELTDELLDLTATEKGYHGAWYAADDEGGGGGGRCACCCLTTCEINLCCS